MSECLDFLAAIQDKLIEIGCEELSPFFDALSGIDLTAKTRPRKPVCEHTTMSYLEALLNGAYDKRFAVAARALDFLQVYEGDGIDPILSEGMFAAQFAGTYGRYPSIDVATGLFLLAPEVHYPLHTHAAAEVYLCISGCLQLRHGINGKPFEIAASELSLTPSGRAHELKTSLEPALLAYVWIGDILAPTWCWEEKETGGWNRSSWKRETGEPWRKVGTEPLSDEDIERAS